MQHLPQREGRGRRPGTGPGEEFLRLAASMQLQVHRQEYPLDQADRALADRVNGAAVLTADLKSF